MATAKLPPLKNVPKISLPTTHRDAFSKRPKKPHALPVPGLTGKAAATQAELFHAQNTRRKSALQTPLTQLLGDPTKNRRKSAAGGPADRRRSSSSAWRPPTKNSTLAAVSGSTAHEEKVNVLVGAHLKESHLDHNHAELKEALKQTTHLNLTGKWIRDTGVETLAACLAHNETIVTLNLSRNDIGPRGVNKLIRVLRDTKIVTLDLSQNRIGNLGAKALADVLPLLEIQSLNLFRNNITSTAVLPLATGLRLNRTIHTLELRANNVSYGPAVSAMEDTVYLRSIHTTVNLQTGSICIADGSGEREGRCQSNYTDGRQLETLWRSGYIVRGRMHYPNGDTFEISEGGQDGVPAQGVYIMDKVARAKWYQKVVVVLGSSVGMVDFGTDVNVLFNLWLQEQYAFFAVSLTIVVFAVAVACATLWRNGRRLACLFQLVSAAPLLDSIHMVRGSRQKVRNFDLHQKECMHGYSSINQLKLTEALLESAPQSVVQLYIGFRTVFSPSLVASVALSLASLAFSLAMTDRRSVIEFARSEYMRQLHMALYSWRFSVLGVYRLMEVASRAMTLAVLAAVFQTLFPVALGFAYLAMWTYWWSSGVGPPIRFVHLFSKFGLIWYSLLAFPGFENVCPPWVKKEERRPAWVYYLVVAFEDAGILAALFLLDTGGSGAESVTEVVKWTVLVVVGLKYFMLPCYAAALFTATSNDEISFAQSLKMLGAFSKRMGESGTHDDPLARPHPSRAAEVRAQNGPAVAAKVRKNAVEPKRGKNKGKSGAKVAVDGGDAKDAPHTGAASAAAPDLETGHGSHQYAAYEADHGYDGAADATAAYAEGYGQYEYGADAGTYAGGYTEGGRDFDATAAATAGGGWTADATTGADDATAEYAADAGGYHWNEATGYSLAEGDGQHAWSGGAATWDPAAEVADGTGEHVDAKGAATL